MELSPGEIKRRRLAYPMTVKQLAEIMGVTVSAVRQWEYGDRKPFPKHEQKLRVLFQKRDGCRCSCHGTAPRPHRPAWTWEEDDYLRQNVQQGKLASVISQELREKFLSERTVKAVYTRAKYLGLDFQVLLTSREVQRKLGVTQYRIRQFIAQGLLPTWRQENLQHGVPTRWLVIHPEDLRKFVIQHYDKLDPDLMADSDLKHLINVARIESYRAERRWNALPSLASTPL